MSAGAAQVSVVLTCYNEAAFIGAAIESVQAQTASASIKSIIVVDDGSTDESSVVLARFAAADSRLVVRTIANGGLAAARNEALLLVDTEFFAILDGDDLWREDKLARQLAAAAASDAALFYGDVVEFTHTPGLGRRTQVRRFTGDELDQLERYFVYDAPILPSTILVRTEAAREIGFFRANVRLFEDTDFYRRLAAAGGRFAYVDGVLAEKRQRAASLSAQIGKWEHAMLAASQAWGERDVRLRGLVRARNGYRLSKIAQAYLKVGDAGAARRYALRALRLNPGNGRAYAYAALACLPHALSRRVYGPAGGVMAT